MPDKIPVFKSPEIEAQYQAVYATALELWPVPYDELFIPTRLGDTHIIASGSKDAPPLFLFQPTGAGAAIWYRNAQALSQHYRVYALDTIGEVNESILTRPIQSDLAFMDWILDLWTELGITRTDIVGNSFGGFLSVKTAYHLPERVGKVVLISPAGHPSASGCKGRARPQRQPQRAEHCTRVCQCNDFRVPCYMTCSVLNHGLFT